MVLVIETIKQSDGSRRALTSHERQVWETAASNRLQSLLEARDDESYRWLLTQIDAPGLAKMESTGRLMVLFTAALLIPVSLRRRDFTHEEFKAMMLDGKAPWTSGGRYFARMERLLFNALMNGARKRGEFAPKPLPAACEAPRDMKVAA